MKALVILLWLGLLKAKEEQWAGPCQQGGQPRSPAPGPTDCPRGRALQPLFQENFLGICTSTAWTSNMHGWCPQEIFESLTRLVIWTLNTAAESPSAFGKWQHYQANNQGEDGFGWWDPLAANHKPVAPLVKYAHVSRWSWISSPQSFTKSASLVVKDA